MNRNLDDPFSGGGGEPEQAPKAPAVDGKKETKKEDVMIPLSEVERIINEKLASIKKESPVASATGSDDIRNLTAALMDAMNKESEKKGMFALVRQDEIDPKDVLEVPVVFWAYGHSYAIHSENRNGHNVMPPFNKPLRFEHSWTEARGLGREKDVFKVCCHTTYSKKVADWIRSSKDFKLKIFDNVAAVADIDMHFASKVAEVANSLAGQSPQYIMFRCQEKGIEITQDFNAMKQKLIELLAKEESEKIKKVNLSSARSSDMDKEKIVKQGPGNPGTERIPVQSY